jgi:hypothetical protein
MFYKFEKKGKEKNETKIGKRKDKHQINLPLKI